MAARPDRTPAVGQASEVRAGFEVRLTNFTGPFDLLLGLIAKHEMDITEVALATVTDEFIAYIRRFQESGEDWALDEASEFVVLAATLLDLKAARLLPAADGDEDEDLALLEARDLLFARLLQYKAFKEVATLMEAALDREALRFPRLASLEAQFARLLPELDWPHTPEQFAALAEAALAPKEAPVTHVQLDHLHSQPVSVREQAGHLAALLAAAGRCSFRELCADAQTPMVVIARFLALLEMFRDAVITFEQEDPLGELLVRWVAPDGWSSDGLGGDFDEPTDDPSDGPSDEPSDDEGEESP